MVTETFVGVYSCKSGIFWGRKILLSMETSFEILGAICGVNGLEKNHFLKFKGPFPGNQSLLGL